ncbi:thioredoxin domain-containing protein [Malonomonas rubra]|uniref:thioredoxin domain-containing protein n=1 Tax=Malonomonas rubra TaxID=57040 RepID=UPI0026EC573D|nr:thioredoxin domain-containing protein [Malonomonas rubra]
MMTADYQIICDKCRAINRVPQKRLYDKPKCGKCRKLLFDGGLLELSDGNFQRLLSVGNQPMLVMFWAPWCGYCQKTLPAFRQAVAELEPELRMATLNTEVNKFSASRMIINSLPTFVLFKHGQEVARRQGAIHFEQIVAWANGII